MVLQKKGGRNSYAQYSASEQFQPPTRMDKVNKYYNKHRILLSLVGLWPYTSEKCRRILNILCTIILVSGVVVQITPALTVEYTVDILLDNLSPGIIIVGVLNKYVTFWYKAENVKEIMRQVKYDWNTIKDATELDILTRHAFIGHFYSKLFASFICPCAIVQIMSFYVPDVLDIIVPLNESRLHGFPVMLEFFIDQQKYFHFLAIYVEIGLFVASITIVSTETVFFMWLQHTSGLFEIASYRIKQPLQQCWTDPHIGENDIESQKILVSAIKIHRKAVNFYQNLGANFTLNYSILLTFAVSSISINLYRLSQAILLSKSDDFLISGVFVVSQLGYSFYLNYMVQQVLDSSSDVFNTIYQTKWYEMSLPVQKNLLFIMLRTEKSCGFYLLGLFEPSIEGFGKLAKMSLSYFMVINSTQGGYD